MLTARKLLLLMDIDIDAVPAGESLIVTEDDLDITSEDDNDLITDQLEKNKDG